MPSVQRWCRITVLGPDGAVLARRVLEGPGDPDVDAVEVVARMALLSGRVSGTIGIAEVSPEMRDLLDLAGLRIEAEG
jgi:hypothetical protein